MSAVEGQICKIVSINALIEGSLIGACSAGIIFINERTIIGNVAIIATETVTRIPCGGMITTIRLILDNAIAIDGDIGQRCIGNIVGICHDKSKEG